MTLPAEGTLGDLAFWTFGLDAQGEFLLMLRAVADESHDSNDAKVMTMAGFLAPKDTWSALWLSWQSVLHDPEFKVDVFHAADCANGAANSPFEGWPLPKRERLQRRLIGVVTESNAEIWGFSVTVPIPEHELLRPRLKKLLTLPSGGAINGPIDDPWFFVLQGFVSAVVNGLVGLPTEEKVGFVFDQHDLQGRAPVIYHSLREMPEYKERLAPSVVFGDRSKIVPLQCADLLAYETFRFVNDSHLRGYPERWQHKALRDRVWAAHYWYPDALGRIVDRTETALAAKRASGQVRPFKPAKKREKKIFKPTLSNRVRRVLFPWLRQLKRWVQR